MTSQKQQDANRRNAQKSTGPRTPAGKGASKLNAVSHGLTAKTIVIAGEDPQAFEAMREELFDEQAPQSGLEAQLLDRLAGILWRLRRIPQIEASLLEAHRLDADYDLAMRGLKQAEEDCRKADTELGNALQRERRVSQLTRKPGNRPALEKARKDRRRRLLTAQARVASPGAMLGRTFRKSLADMDTIGQLSRYEAGLVRLFDTTLAQLKRARKDYRPERSAPILNLASAEVEPEKA